MRRLVASWLQAEREFYGNDTFAKAIAYLKAAVGMRLTHSRLSEWRRGLYTPSPVAQSVMLWRTLPWAIQRAGLKASEAELNALDTLLWETKVQNGEIFVFFSPSEEFRS